MLARRFLAAAVAVFAIGLYAAQDKPDLNMMNRIRYEGLQHSQVGKLAAFLSDVIGPRPTGSPEIDRANRWAAAKMKEWGMTNVALEPYDDFGVGWALRYVSAHLIEPHYGPLIAISVEWGSSTKGKIVGQPICVDIRSKEDFAKYKGKLEGRIIEEFKEPAKMEVEVRTEFYDKDLRGYNVVGEIPGADKADEVVMLGGHIDSWSPGTGAADDGAGCSVSLEAVRILKALGVKPRRTIRVVLWSAEEKGWIGSRAYVEKHFGDPAKMSLKPEHAKLAGYFNFDNGTGRIRGIYAQTNVAVKPIFEEWLKPFNDLGATEVVMRDTGGSDHGALDYIGLPAFQFIQDPLDYGTRVHHTNMDVFDHLVVEDLMQAAVIMAAFVYNTAMREEMLPRKPLPDPMHYPVRR